jgi:hypothetical protein
MNLADIEKFWNNRGHFNMQLYLNYLRVKKQ